MAKHTVDSSFLRQESRNDFPGKFERKAGDAFTSSAEIRSDLRDLESGASKARAP
jgi:hypothetical protein